MRQHQNTNNKVVDNEKGGGRHNKHCLGLLCLAHPKGGGGDERETQSGSVSCVPSEVRRTKRKESFEMNLSDAQGSRPGLHIMTPLPFVTAVNVSIRNTESVSQPT